jgi:hypothetical protein
MGFQWPRENCQAVFCQFVQVGSTIATELCSHLKMHRLRFLVSVQGTVTWEWDYNKFSDSFVKTYTEGSTSGALRGDVEARAKPEICYVHCAMCMPGGSQRGVVSLSWPKEPSYSIWAKNKTEEMGGGGGGVAGFQPMSTAVHIEPK